MTPSGDRIKRQCDSFRRAWRARHRRPDVERPAMTRPRPPKAPDLSRIGKVVKAKGKGMDPPPGFVKPRGSTWNRFHGKLEWKVKIGRRSHHLGYSGADPGSCRVGALRWDRIKYRATGSRAFLNFPDHEQLSRVVPDGIPRDPFEGRARGEGGGA